MHIARYFFQTKAIHKFFYTTNFFQHEQIMSPSWLSRGVLLNSLDVCTPMC